MEFVRKVLVFLALLSVLLVYFMYIHCDSFPILNVHFRYTSASKLPRHLSTNCSERFCMQFLTHDDKDAFDGCIMLTGMEKEKGSCYFMNQTLRFPVALASFQGSGSTWVRGLLEQATGFCTGSVYCDPWLRAGGFTGENIRSGAVLVTKTHYPAYIERGIELIHSAWEGSKDPNADHIAEDINEDSASNGTTTVTALYLTEEITNHSRQDATKDSKDDAKTLSPKGITDPKLTDSEATPQMLDVKDEPEILLQQITNLPSDAEGVTEDVKTPSITEGIKNDPKTLNATEGTEEDPGRLYVISSNSIPHWGYAQYVTLEWTRIFSGIGEHAGVWGSC